MAAARKITGQVQVEAFVIERKAVAIFDTVPRVYEISDSLLFSSFKMP